MALGALPAIIVTVLLIVALIALGASVQGLVGWMTPFADEWDEGWRTLLRGFIAVTIVLGVLVIAIVGFTAITLAVGAPFYDRIRLEVDRLYGEPTTPEKRGFWADLGRGLGNGIRTVSPTVVFAILVLPVGLIPVVGSVLVAILSAIFGGWFLVVELSGSAADARGMTLTERRRLLRAHRARSFGIGIASYLLFLIPLGAVFAMPGAVAGATVLVRTARGESTVLERAAGAPPASDDAPTGSSTDQSTSA